MSMISPESFTDEELEAMSYMQQEKLHETCQSWMDALRICPEWWEYSALQGRIEAIWQRKYERYEAEDRGPSRGPTTEGRKQR